ncbi:MAG: hypothetical protein KF725_01895 [Cyclobacteriaceae bacterium]|nr:hypothetical protein [Cyclobacteriaceae bacterium]UYN86804.1 MAG: hypothetical protein KIT51_00510 [Cyclobacteriaceae bacterium]
MKPRFYRGIEYVRVDDLPAEQQALLQMSFTYPERISILIDGKIIRNCIQYEPYTEWYTHVFQTSVAPGILKSSPEQKQLVEKVMAKV